MPFINSEQIYLEDRFKVKGKKAEKIYRYIYKKYIESLEGYYPFEIIYPKFILF